MRKLLIAAAVTPLLACSAENLERMQAQTPPILELSHRVTVRLQRGAVMLNVNRQLRNESAEYQELTHLLAVPQAAVVTSLRVDSEGVLLGAEEAESRWSELIAPGEAEPSTSAMLQWVEGEQLELRLFAVAPGATVSIEYELQLPPVYEAGGWVFDYPREDSDDWALAVPTFDLSRLPDVAVEEEPTVFRVRIPRTPIDRTDAKWALYRLGPERTMWRLELDAAQILEAAAPRPNVVFVIDASHSQGEEGIKGQLELLGPYLANAPDAQVEVVLYRRFAQRLFGQFIPAGEVPGRLAGLLKEKLTPGNGSNLELGARLAAEALAQVPGVGRIVLFTDQQLRTGFCNQLALAELAKAPPDTVVHLVSRASENGSGELAEKRELDNALAPIAGASGGVFLSVKGHPEDPQLAANALLGLVRPIRIDDFKIEANGLGDTSLLDVPEELIEGATLRSTAIAARPPPK